MMTILSLLSLADFIILITVKSYIITCMAVTVHVGLKHCKVVLQAAYFKGQSS